MVGGMAQQIAHGEELRLVVHDDAAVGRDVYLAVGEGIEGIDGLVAAHARCQMELYLYVAGCQVVNAAHLYLSFRDGFEDGLLETVGSLAVGHFPDDERLGIKFLNARPDLYLSASLSVVVSAYIDGAPVGKSG